MYGLQDVLQNMIMYGSFHTTANLRGGKCSIIQIENTVIAIRNALYVAFRLAQVMVLPCKWAMDVHTMLGALSKTYTNKSISLEIGRASCRERVSFVV